MAAYFDSLSTLLCSEEMEEGEEEPPIVMPSIYIQSTMPDEAHIASLISQETHFTPKEDYLFKLQSGNVNVSARNDAVDWIYKVHGHYNFAPLTACLSVNYLDRFLSEYELPQGKVWMVQLLSVACLSLAAKMEETDVPLSLDLQVSEETKFVFEARTIQKMELLLLTTLKWRMNAITPFSFIDHFIFRTNPENPIPKSLISRSTQLILKISRGIEFLEFRPSELASAVAIFVSREIQPAVDFHDAMDSCSPLINKEKVSKCYELIEEIETTKDCCFFAGKSFSGESSASPKSPIGVLEAGCLSFSSCSGCVGISNDETMRLNCFI
ncbi:hypothetical protein AMTRI_Chr01g104860 [Amborella trichopoda]